MYAGDPKTLSHRMVLGFARTTLLAEADEVIE